MASRGQRQRISILMSLTQRLNKPNLNIQIVETSRKGWNGTARVHCFIQIPSILKLWLRGGEGLISRVTLRRRLDKKKPGNGSTGDDLERGEKRSASACVDGFLFVAGRSAACVAGRPIRRRRNASAQLGFTCQHVRGQPVKRLNKLRSATRRRFGVDCCGGQPIGYHRFNLKMNFFSFWVSRLMSSSKKPRGQKMKKLIEQTCSFDWRWQRCVYLSVASTGAISQTADACADDGTNEFLFQLTDIRICWLVFGVCVCGGTRCGDRVTNLRRTEMNESRRPVRYSNFDAQQQQQMSVRPCFSALRHCGRLTAASGAADKLLLCEPQRRIQIEDV